MQEEQPPKKLTLEEIAIEEEGCLCCCCVCHCSVKETKDLACCGCFPIKCGVLTIGIFTLLLAIYMVTMNFFLILNEYIHWYFPVVILVLLAPLCIAASFFVTFFTKDT